MLAGVEKKLQGTQVPEAIETPFMPTKCAVSENRSSIAVPASLRALLTDLIDYAGLFPPAGLGMSEAVENYARYLGGEHAWILGRFVVPANRLAEFAQAHSAMETQTPWRLSCLVGADTESDLSEIERFRGWARAQIVSIETKAQISEEVRRFKARLPDPMTLYFEVPLNCSAELLITIRQAGARAKIRVGGLTPEAIPSGETVAGFLARCASIRTPFKATAGLHHPIRCLRPLTDQAAAPSAKMHGFLNVFLAAALAYHGASAERLRATLETEKAPQFAFESQTSRCAEGILSREQIQAAREQFAVSFGSCSFEEPIEDLRALQLL